jgi:hypothetical protein
MVFHGWTQVGLQQAIDEVNRLTYDGNVRVEISKVWLVRCEPRIRAVLRVKNSRALGARLAPSGRHTPAASWEVHRDVMTILFDMNPEGWIHSALAKYNGRGDFRANFPATEYHQVGSTMYPVSIGECTLIPE